MRRAWAWTIVVALTSGVATSCGDKRSDGLRHVRSSFSNHISFGPLMIAQAEGYFRDEGLDVEFIETMQPEETLVALVTGDIDVRPGALHAGFLSAIAQGAPIRMVAGLGVLAREGCTYFGIALRAGLDPGTPAIRRVRASKDGVTRYVTSRMLEMRGLSLTSLETVRLPEPVMASALESGAIDAGAASEPTLSRMASIGKLWLSGQDALPDFQWGVMMFGERFLVRERDTAMRFIRAYRRGITQYRLGKTDRNVAIIAQGTGETEERTRAACWIEFSEDLHIDWASIEGFQAWANKEKFMERVVSREQAVDSGFMTPPSR